MYNDRIVWMEHKGKKILKVDYSNMTAEQISGIMEELKKIIFKEPLGSILYFIILENLHFSTKTLSLFNQFSEETSKHDKASALYGITGLIKVMYDSFTKLSKVRVPLKTFDKKDEALDWLASR